MDNCVLDDRVTPADYATVSEALGSLGPLTDPYRVLGALSRCGVVVPNGLNSLVLLCRAEGVATGIDGAWPMDPNDFLKIFAAVRRKTEIDEDNLCDTLEASRFLVSMASQRAASETLDRPTTPPGVVTSPNQMSAHARATGSPTGGSMRRGSFNGNATPSSRHGPDGSRLSRAGSVVSVTPGKRKSMAAATGTPAVSSSLRLPKGAASTRRAVVTVKEHEHSSSGASQAPATADGDNQSLHHSLSLRRSKSVTSATFRSQTDTAQRELAHSLRDAVTEIRTRQRAAAAAERSLRRRLSGDDEDEDDDASDAAATVPADILATTVTVAEMQLLCDGLGIDVAVFEQHLKEKARLEKLMSFAKPKSQRLHEKLQKKKGSSMRPDVSMSLGALATSSDDDGDSDGASSSANYTTAVVSPAGPVLTENAMSPESAGSPLLAPSAAARLDTSMSDGGADASGALMSFKLSRTATQMRRHRPSISAKYAGASVSIFELSQWIATPSTIANANTPRTSVRAKARWRRCLDVIRAKGQRARSSWNDLSANIRRLVQARRAAAEGGVATANFDLTSTTDAITQRLHERCRLHEERVVAKRVSLRPAAEIEGADAVLNSMPAARGNNDLMLRQLCTPCFGPSRACIMARRLREWRQGPTRARGDDDDLSNGSRSPDQQSLPPSPQQAPTPQPRWLASGANVGRPHGGGRNANATAGSGGHSIAFAAFDDGDAGTASLAHDGTSFQMAVNAPSQDQLDVQSDAGSQTAADAAETPPSPGPAAPAADEEPAPVVDAAQMARWTAGGTHVENRRPSSASRGTTTRSGSGRRPFSSQSPSLGPRGGPTSAKASELAQLVADNRRAAQLERSFLSLGTTAPTPTAQRRAESRPPSRATTVASPEATAKVRPEDFLPQSKPSPLAISPFKNRRRIAVAGSPAAGSRPTSAAGRGPSSRPVSAASNHRR